MAEAAHSSTPSPYSRTLPADHLHAHLFRHAGKDFARDGVYGAKPWTVRDWLQSIAHPDDAAKLAPEA